MSEPSESIEIFGDLLRDGHYVIVGPMSSMWLDGDGNHYFREVWPDGRRVEWFIPASSPFRGYADGRWVPAESESD